MYDKENDFKYGIKNSDCSNEIESENDIENSDNWKFDPKKYGKECVDIGQSLKKDKERDGYNFEESNGLNSDKGSMYDVEGAE